MSRIARNSLALLVGGLSAPIAATGADWTETGFHGAHVDDWALPADDPISIEMGTRYWYDLGSHRMDVIGDSYGAFTVAGPGGTVQGSAAELSGGWLYGAAGEVMARFHRTENWTIGVGGRAWYLRGEADVNFSTRDPLSPGDQQDWITKTEEFSTLRYGLLGEITYKF